MNASDLITLTAVREHEFNVTCKRNGVPLGVFCQEEGGYYVFFEEPVGRGGFWEAHMLRALADELDRLNEPWNKELEIFFREHAVPGSVPVEI